jgi:hypothetical protein
MKTTKKFPNIAILFSILAIATSLILLLDAPKIISYLFAVFWFATGLLGFHIALKNKKI